MELAGDEKRIQALFSDLRFEDQGIAPSFDRLWKSAQTTKPNPIAFVHPLVVLGSLIIIGATWAIGVWSRDASTLPTLQYDVALVVPITVESRTEAPKKRRTKSHSMARRREVRPAEIDQAVINEALALSSWQSPTYGLMQSAGGSVFKALPELGQSIQELESYLSNNEVKEWNK